MSPPTVPGRFAAQVRTDPDAVAVLAGDLVLPYGELDAWAGTIAARLTAGPGADGAGVGPGDTVALCLPRSAAYVAALLGVLRTGAAAVLLDPRDPAGRLRAVLADAGPAALLVPAGAGRDDLAVPRTVPLAATPPPAPEAGPIAAVDAEAAAIVVATSGSTGRPKSVVLSHRACCAGIDWAARTFGLGPADRHLFKTSVSFVSVLRHLLWPLLTGGATVVVPPGEEANLPLLADLVRRHRVSVTTFIPSSFRLFLDARGAAGCTGLRHVVCGGEVLTPELRALAGKVLPDTTLHNVYALSEAPLVTHWRCRPDEAGTSPMGSAVAGARLLVLGDDGTPAAPGTPGELLVGGPGIASGYLGGDPAEEDRFVADRWPGAASALLYRTGDRVVADPAGVLRYVGRRDQRVKVHGYRIELGEIETAAATLPGVTTVAVLAEPARGSDHDLVLYAAATLTPAELRAGLGRALPAYMVPPRVHVLDRLPLLPNGKLDRAALPALATTPAPDSPGGGLAGRVAAEWCAVLSAATGAPDEDFFAAGGDSLAAMRLANRLQAVADETAGPAGAAVVSVHTVVGHPVLRDLVTAVRAAAEESPAAEPGPDRAPGDAFEPTDLQRAYWLGARGLYPLSTVAHVRHEYQVALLDPDALHAALARLVARHDVLRTVVGPDGSQTVLPAVPVPRPAETDLRGADLDGTDLRGADLDGALEKERAAAVADLPDEATGPPFAVRVARLADGWRVLLVVRLAALDGQSLRRFLAELAALLRRPEVELPPPSGRYRDLVAAATDPPARRRAAALRHWAAVAGDLPPGPGLPLRDRLPDRSAFTRRHTRLPAAEAAVLRERCARHGLTVSAVLATAYGTTLRRWSARPDFSLTALSGLRPASGESDDVLGNLGTTVLLDCRDADGSFAERARALQEQLYAAVAHHDVSGMEVLRRFSTAHRSAESSFVPYVFAPGRGLTGPTESPAPPELTAPGWRLVDSGIATPQVLLDHQAYGDGDELVLNWDAVDDAFPDGLLDEAFAFHRGLLDRLLAPGADWDRLDPATVPLPAGQLLARWRANHTAGPLPDGRLQDGFLSVAARSPERVAVLDGDVALTYGELHGHAADLAGRLGAAGIAAGDLVAVRAGRRWQQVAAVLGVLQAGGAYLPVDPGWPAERVAWLLDQSGARALVGEPVAGGPAVPVVEVGGVEVGSGAGARPVRPGPGDPGDLAYVIYTSGSTGRPKGVAVSHRAALNTVRDITERFAVTGADRTLGLSALSFDLSVFDLFGLLGAGGAVVGVAPGPPDPAAWARLVGEHGVTVWNSVPAILELLLDHLGPEAAGALGGLRLVLLSGDWVPVSLPARLRAAAPDARLVALGGATEAAIWSNSYPVGDPDPGWPSVPYGHPLTNQRMHVLDRRLADVPTWVPGDLHIAGAGLARGYHRDPERTAASFLVRPDGSERLYRTGDLARYRPDGCLEFLGRADDQVKIDGYRIELGEVESTLLRCPGVRAAAAVVVGEPGHDRRLAAFVVPAAGEPDLAAVRAALAGWLPAYMVPRELSVLDELPLTGNGKVDRVRLVAAARDAGPAVEEVVAPRTATERAVVALWAEVLGRDEVSATADFFAAGGNSRAAVQLMNRIRDRLGGALSLRHLFEHPTPAAQAALLDEGTAPAGHGLVPLRAGSGAGAVVLVHPIGGGVLCYRELVEALPPGPVVLGAQHAGLDGGPVAGSVAELADRYGQQLAAAVPGGDVVLAGWSMGGVIALEIARRLGPGVVRRVVVLDGWAAADPAGPPADPADVEREFRADLAAEPAGEQRLFAVYQANHRALREHRPVVPDVPVDLFAARAATARRGLVRLHEALGRPAVYLDTDHDGIVARPAVAGLAAHLAGYGAGCGAG